VNAPVGTTRLTSNQLAELAKTDPSALIVNADDMRRAPASALTGGESLAAQD